ncbi:MAG: type II secretion system protein [Thermaceae bacterium]|nr:type II secretion system protein [Thermaceae bacterium]
MRQAKGLTLIEVLVAVGIIAILAAVIFSGVMSSLQANRVSRYKTQADQCTQSVVERYRVFWNSTDSLGKPLYNKYPSKVDPTSRPITNDLCLNLPSSYTVTTNDQGQYNQDGSVFTPSIAVPVPPLRGLEVLVSDGTKTLSDIKTQVGQPVQ